MADAADNAFAVEDGLRQEGLSKIQRYEGESKTHCEECGEPIPKKRQEVIRGVKLCITCQEWEDWRKARLGG